MIMIHHHDKRCTNKIIVNHKIIKCQYINIKHVYTNKYDIHVRK